MLKEFYRMPFSMALRNLLVFGLLSVVMAMGTAWAQEWVSIRNDNVNMRAGPGTNHAVQWKLARGFPLQVVQRRNNWLQVRDFEGDTGWVARSVTSNIRHHIVKGQNVNLRAGPGTNHRVVGRAKYGEVLRTVRRQGRWAEVRMPNGRNAWIAANLVFGW
jgi:SH3-like domain-containing protein